MTETFDKKLTKGKLNDNKPKVTVIIPTLNEEKSIGQTLDEIPKDFAELESLVPNYLRPPDIRPNPFAPRSEEPAKQVLS